MARVPETSDVFTIPEVLLTLAQWGGPWLFERSLTNWEHCRKGSGRNSDIPQSMWKTFKNFLRSVATYRTLSPDVRLRRQVIRWLRDRSPLPLEVWVKALRDSWGISKAVGIFAYTHLEKYSGLPTAQLRPSDRLDADLHWTMVCWFDWQLCLCEDFCHKFGVDISDRLEQCSPNTLADLLVFLDKQLPNSNTPERSPYPQKTDPI